MLFVKTKNSNGGDTVAYYHHDHLDTPIQATDKNDNVVWSAQYNMYGRATITIPTASLDKPTISSDLRLPGQIEDEEMGCIITGIGIMSRGWGGMLRRIRLG